MDQDDHLSGVESRVLTFERWAAWMAEPPPPAPDKAYSERLQVCLVGGARGGGVLIYMCVRPSSVMDGPLPIPRTHTHMTQSN